MLEIKKHYRGDLSYTIESVATMEQVRAFCKNYLRDNPGANLRIWDATAKHWVGWYPEGCTA